MERNHFADKANRAYHDWNRWHDYRAFDNDAAQSTVSSERVDFEAEAVAAYLWTQRVSNTLRYSGVGRGQHPVSTNRVASIGAANSRIEIEFLYDGK